jgi:hypothetical protein
MATIKEMAERWHKLNLLQITGDAMVTNDAKIVELNREQLNEGVRADGSPITPKYTPFTIMKKIEKGQRFDVVTLRDTGSFQDKMKLFVAGAKFTVVSQDEKAKKLEGKYGDIMGLSDSGKKEAWLIVRPDVVQEIRNETGCI